MKTFLILLFVTVSLCRANDASDGVLLLRVSLVREVHPKKIDGSTFDAYIRATLTNVSDHEVTVPTTSYDGKPCCFTHGDDYEGVTYEIGVRALLDGALAKPSPLRFLPVTLKPGETTELPEYGLGSSNVGLVRVSFSVQNDYAKEQSWWSGNLRAKSDQIHRK
jgi:hypothetical protein